MKYEPLETYHTIIAKTWPQILQDNRIGAYQPPITVHLPLQPIHSPDLLHLDAALNVSRRRVIENLPFKGYLEAAKGHEMFLVQFALDEQPFVPDWRFSRFNLDEGKFPVVRAQYYSWDMVYDFSYACCPLDDRQSLLWIDVSVCNEATWSQPAHVRVKVDFPFEADIFDYHYVPFYWDASKWRPSGNEVQLKGAEIYRKDRLIGRCIPGEFVCEWEAESHFRHDQYKQMGMGISPAPHMRVLDVNNAIHFHADMAPGQRRNLALAFLIVNDAIEDRHAVALRKADSHTVRQAAVAHFQKPFTPTITTLKLASNPWEDLFVALQLSSLQLMIQFPNEPWLLPTQGSSSERHFVWVWEAVCMLRPLLWLGHFEPVKRALDFFFSLQDGGFPPEGKFTSLKGAIGTTGPKWMNSTGSALGLAAEYYLITRDRDFLQAYLPRIRAAAGWILGEIRATRKLNPDGSRPLYYGLMPFGCATDADVGYIVTSTDTYTHWGVKKAAELFEAIGHEDAAGLRCEVVQYGNDIRAAIVGMTRPDGYIERKIMTDDKETVHEPKFENVVGAIHYVYTDLLDPAGEPFQRYLAFFERHCVQGAFLGNMDRDVAYMGVGEWLWQDAYLKLGQWKKAFLACQTNLKYGMTQDTFQVQERFSRYSPAFTPWQPNGSGNGKILEMMLKSIYFEVGDTATLLGGIPWQWLVESGGLALENVHTPHGRISVRVEKVGPEEMILRLIFHDEPNWLRKVRLPDFLKVTCMDATTKALENNWYDVEMCTKHVVLNLSRGEA